MGIDELKLHDCKYSELESKIRAIRARELESEVLQHKAKICEEIIEYSLYLYHATNTIINTAYLPTGKRVNEKCTWISELYERNFIYLISAYELCRSGLINPANLALRSVFEAVGQIYLMQLTTKEAELFLKMELSNQNSLSEAEEKEIKKCNHFSPSFVRGKLYEKSSEKKKNIYEFYDAISKRAHPRVKSAHSSFTIDPDMLDDTLNVILSLGIANVIAYWETLFSILNDNNIKKFDFLLNNIYRDLNIIPFDIIPNEPHILTGIRFKNLESFAKSF